VVGQSLRYTCMYLCYTTLPPPQSAGTQDPCIQTLDGRVRTKHCAGVLDSPEDIPASELRCKDQFIAPRSHHPIILVDCQTSLPAGRMRNIRFKSLSMPLPFPTNRHRDQAHPKSINRTSLGTQPRSVTVQRSLPSSHSSPRSPLREWTRAA
jgi:hypothetical protein